MPVAIWSVAALTALAGLIVLIRMRETRPDQPGSRVIASKSFVAEGAAVLGSPGHSALGFHACARTLGPAWFVDAAIDYLMSDNRPLRRSRPASLPERLVQGRRRPGSALRPSEPSPRA
jgi:hypothetical protein